MSSPTTTAFPPAGATLPRNQSNHTSTRNSDRVGSAQRRACLVKPRAGQPVPGAIPKFTDSDHSTPIISFCLGSGWRDAFADWRMRRWRPDRDPAHHLVFAKPHAYRDYNLKVPGKTSSPKTKIGNRQSAGSTRVCAGSPRVSDFSFSWFRISVSPGWRPRQRGD